MEPPRHHRHGPPLAAAALLAQRHALGARVAPPCLGGLLGARRNERREGRGGAQWRGTNAVALSPTGGRGELLENSPLAAVTQRVGATFVDLQGLTPERAVCKERPGVEPARDRDRGEPRGISPGQATRGRTMQVETLCPCQMKTFWQLILYPYTSGLHSDLRRYLGPRWTGQDKPHAPESVTQLALGRMDDRKLWVQPSVSRGTHKLWKGWRQCSHLLRTSTPRSKGLKASRLFVCVIWSTVIIFTRLDERVFVHLLSNKQISPYSFRCLVQISVLTGYKSPAPRW